MPAHQGLSAAPFGGPPLQREEYVTTEATGCSELHTLQTGGGDYVDSQAILRMTIPFPPALAADGIPQSRFPQECLTYGRAGKPAQREIRRLEGKSMHATKRPAAHSGYRYEKIGHQC